MFRFSLMTAMTALALAAGCSNSGLDVPIEMKPANNVTVSGSLNGTFTALVHAAYNRKSAKDQTTISILSVANPGLGIDTFSVDAILSGMPQAKHYSEMLAQITAGVFMIDSRVFQSNVNSQNRIDITGVSAPAIQDDGSSVYALQGSAAGSAVSTESSQLINFVVTF